MDIALIAHDEKKESLLDWAKYNVEFLGQHTLWATRSTGNALISNLGLFVHCFNSGPLGGDQQIGARMATGDIDLLIFFWDPMEAHPHDPDVRALLRLAVLYNIPVACNRATADFLISSPLASSAYHREQPVELH